jgi:hypothetical protein
MENFHNCSLGTRIAVFYDLLVVLLLDFPERQTAITQWPEFNALPKDEQARLFRLMANMTVIYGKDHTFVRYWLDRSLQLNQANLRSAVLLMLFQLHPKLLSLVLKLRYFRQIDPRTVAPFADMKINSEIQ